MSKSKIIKWLAGILILISLSWYPLTAHLKTRGINYIIENDILRHTSVIEGHSVLFFNPWQYRILSAWLLEGLNFFTHLVIKDSNQSYFTSFIIFRFAEHLLILILAFNLYKRFTSSNLLIVLALSLLSFSMAHSTHGSDLSFNSYLDVILYLLAMLILVYNKNLLLMFPLCTLAALNRETAILIPALVFTLGFKVYFFPKFKVAMVNKQAALVGIASTLAFIAVFIGLRMYFGFAQNHVFDGTLKWLIFNLTNDDVYFSVFGTITLLPLLSIFALPMANPILKAAFWTIIPVWFIVHYTMVAAWESRVFLTPVAVVFLPLLIEKINNEIASTTAPNRF